MFLKLMSDRQKDLFLDLCIYAAGADGEWMQQERQLLLEYCNEMETIGYREEPQGELDEVITELVRISSPIQLRMLSVELTGLFLSDQKYSDAEKAFGSAFFERSGLDEKQQSQITEMLQKLQTISEKATAFVQGEYVSV